MQNPPTLTAPRLDHLHALRGFCALYVVVYHAKYLLWAGGTRYQLAFPVRGWHLGDYLGVAAAQASAASVELVIFFFVLSGFFIRYAWQRRPRTAGAFYRNRVARIYPPYLASLALAALGLAGLAAWCPPLLAVVPGHEQNAGMLSAWQMLQQHPLAAVADALVFARAGPEYFGYNSVYWSLPPEAIFYLLVPLAFWRVRGYYGVAGGLWLLGLGAQLRGLDTPLWLDGLLLYQVYFALGVALHDWLVARPGVVQAVGRVPGWPLAGAWLALLGLVVALASLHWRLLAGPLAAGLAGLSVLALLGGRPALVAHAAAAPGGAVQLLAVSLPLPAAAAGIGPALAAHRALLQLRALVLAGGAAGGAGLLRPVRPHRAAGRALLPPARGVAGRAAILPVTVVAAPPRRLHLPAQLIPTFIFYAGFL